MGRLIRVIENPTGIGSVVGIAANPGSQSTTTRYGYDGASRLPVVCPSPGYLVLQTGSPLCYNTPMVRTFQYDLLGRLRVVNQPESSSITYNYDETASTNGKGNLTSRVRSQGVASPVSVTTRYHYDGLGRTTGIQYSGAPDGYTTPDVTMSYDVHYRWCLSLVSVTSAEFRIEHDDQGQRRLLDSRDPTLVLTAGNDASRQVRVVVKKRGQMKLQRLYRVIVPLGAQYTPVLNSGRFQVEHGAPGERLASPFGQPAESRIGEAAKVFRLTVRSVTR